MGPVMSSRPVRQILVSASVDGHSSFPLQKRSGPLWGQWSQTLLLCLASRFTCFSPWSAQTAASMMRSEGKW